MREVLYIICTTLSYAIGLEQLLMLVRALMSWLPIDEDGRLYNFIYSATEPVIMPVRAFLDRFEYVRNMPIDISFLAAYLLLSVVGMLLPQLR